MRRLVLFALSLVFLLVHFYAFAFIAAAEDAKVKIFFQSSAQVELISPKGSRVLIDVAWPSSLSTPAIDKDILLTTHGHGDHMDLKFLQSFPGQTLNVMAGTVKTEDVTIQGIASSHDSIKTPQPKGGSNYIFLVEIGGLRIAHFGDIGQDRLTTEQLSLLGRVDIAITQLDNPVSDMTIANKKGFKLMEQVQPRLVIPTHSSAEAMKTAAAMWPPLYSDRKSVSIGQSDLTDNTRVLFLGIMAESYAKMTNAVKIDW